MHTSAWPIGRAWAMERWRDESEMAEARPKTQGIRGKHLALSLRFWTSCRFSYHDSNILPKFVEVTSMPTHIEIKKLDDFRWLIPRKGKMRTDGLVYADGAMMAVIREDQSLEQVANVACLPGIVGRSLAMPDIHWGYGFPIGGVAGFDMEDGIISPGGVGYDIN